LRARRHRLIDFADQALQRRRFGAGEKAVNDRYAVVEQSLARRSFRDFHLGHGRVLQQKLDDGRVAKSSRPQSIGDGGTFRCKEILP